MAILESKLAIERAIFGANRAYGSVAFSTRQVKGKSRRAEVFEEGSLRVRFPTSSDDVLDAILVNTAGGMAGGDEFTIDIAVGANSHLSVTTVAAEKIYRSTGADANANVKLAVATGGSLAWLPQETILFDRSRFSRSIDVDLKENASILLAESTIFGRTAMGEQMESGALFDRWRIRREGRMIFAETFRLDGLIAAQLKEDAINRGGAGLATIVMVPGLQAHVDLVRDLAGEYRGEVGGSAWNGIAVVRCSAADGAALRHDVTMILSVLGDRALPRLWHN